MLSPNKWPCKNARPPCVFMNSSTAASFCASLPKILAMMHSSSPRNPWSSSHEHQSTRASQPTISAAIRPIRRWTSSRDTIAAPYVRRNWAQGSMFASITRIDPAAVAHSATRPRFKP